MMMWPGAARSALTLSFDDGYAATWAATARLLQERGICATYNVITGRVGTDFENLPTATWADWRAATEMGHEVAAHGVSHAALAGSASDLRRLLRDYLVSPDRRAAVRGMVSAVFALRHARGGAAPQPGPRRPRSPVAELALSRNAIEAALGAAPESFVYPAGRHDRVCREAARTAGFTSARGLDWGINATDTDRFALRALAVGPALVLADLDPWRALAQAHGGWLVAVFHMVADSHPMEYPYFCPIGNFERWLDTLQESSVWIAPQREVIRYLAERESDRWRG